MNRYGTFGLEEIQERINLFCPDWEYEILEASGWKKPIKLLCKKCGNVISLNKASQITNRVNICSCTKRFKDYKEKIYYLGEICGYEVLEEGKCSTTWKVQHKCGHIMIRSCGSLRATPWHCDKCDNYGKGKLYLSQQEVQERISDEYTVLEYNGVNNKALLKHNNCGKIFKINYLADLWQGRNRGCPTCYQFKSKGEQAIKQWLEENDIKYIPQKTFKSLNKSTYRFDFYLEDYNIAIEYQGEQHYRDNGYFKDRLALIQKRDEIKRQFCRDNNIELIEIPYTQYKQIPFILSSKFNDYPERE